MKPSTHTVCCFFGCRRPEKLTRKTGFEVCGRLLHQVFDWERNKPSRQSLPVRECNFGFVLAFIVCIQAAFKLQVKGLLTWVRKDKQIHVHTYIHTYIHTHTFFMKQFQETRCVPTAGHTPG